MRMITEPIPATLDVLDIANNSGSAARFARHVIYSCLPKNI
jgi:hypothetical protein